MADVTKDPIGLISVNPTDEEYLDIPAKKMTDGQPDTIPTGKYPVKLNDDSFGKVIEGEAKTYQLVLLR